MSVKIVQRLESGCRRCTGTGRVLQSYGPAAAKEQSPRRTCQDDRACVDGRRSQLAAELEPGLRDITGHRVSNLVRVGSGHGSIPQRPDPAFWPGFLFNVVQSVRFTIIVRYRGHWNISHKTSSLVNKFEYKNKCRWKTRENRAVPSFTYFLKYSKVYCTLLYFLN